LQNLSERNFEILLDVVAESLEWGHVENFGPVVEFARKSFADEAIDACEERGQRFTRSSRSGNQRGVAGEDVRPSLLLGFGRRGEARREPLLHQRMSPGERRRDYGRHNINCS
jgi:hypothetical protein